MYKPTIDARMKEARVRGIPGSAGRGAKRFRGQALASAWAAAFVAGLVPAAFGKGAGIEWEKLAIPDGAVWQDSIGEPEASGPAMGALLATDRGGRLYFSNGSKLHIGSQGGTAWKTVAKHRSPYLDPRSPLAAGAQATVQWGEWTSRDGGATWDTTDEGLAHRSYSVLEDGSRLRGSGYDVIDRSSGIAGKWGQVHMGRTYGFITLFAASRTDAVFALPQSDALLCSIDSGKTWTWAQSFIEAANLTGRTVRAFDFEGRLGTPLLLAVKKSANGPGNLLVRLHVYYTQLDTLENAILPDSAITALHVGGDGTIWLGTRGQGVWKASAGSRIFAACNGGLDDLHIQSLATTSDGHLFVLTTEGLYRARAEATGLRPPRPVGSSRMPGGRDAGIALLLPGLPGGLQPFAGSGQPRIRVLPDGRTLNTAP